MITMTSICGITLPFFPMRPTLGGMVNQANVKQVCQELSNGQWIAQKKLNGDRTILAVTGGQILLFNRYNAPFKHTVSNSKDFLKLGPDTILDGEVWQKKFFPFEALAVNGTSLINEGPAIRAAEAELVAKVLKHDWLFTAPDQLWMEQLGSHLPTWEGVVLKKTGTPYIMLGSAGQTSKTWFKRKWQV